MNVRPAKAEDSASILALNEESVRFLSPLSAERLATLSHEAALHLVVEQEGLVIAFLLAFREHANYASVNYQWFEERYPTFLYIDRVVVRQGLRARGAGTLLYERAFSHALQTGVPRLACEYDVEPPNPVSANFHAKFGFREVGRQSVADGSKQVSLQIADTLRIRTTVADDELDLELLYRAAFPTEDLLPLVRQLLREETGVLSLAARIGQPLVGHILFTRCGVGDRADCVALLGPLAVAPSWQRHGVGGALVREGFKRLAHGNLMRILVLGDPNYYGRFGFLPEHSVLPPHALPAAWSDAWQSIDLRTPATTIEGVLSPPAAWLPAALWAP